MATVEDLKQELEEAKKRLTGAEEKLDSATSEEDKKMLVGYFID
jgi:hypothetical protein